MSRLTIVTLSCLLWTLPVESFGLATGEWCGSRQHGDLSKLIPDSFRPDRITMAYTLCGYIPGGPTANFRSACRSHDACYWTYGVNKKVCDQRLRRDLEQSCQQTYHASHRKKHKACCFKAAAIYEMAVDNMGGDSYRAAQNEGQLAAELYYKRTGHRASLGFRQKMAELCMIHNDASGRCHIEYVLNLIIEK